MADVQFFSNIVAPSMSEDGYDVINSNELTNVLSTASVLSATNINNGTANQLLVQSSPNTTSFLPAPTISGTVLKWNGSSIIWEVAVSSVAGRTGDVVLSSSDISGYGEFTTISIPNGDIITFSSTSVLPLLQHTAATLSATTYRSVDFQIQMSVGSWHETTRVVVVHDGTNVTMTEYNTLVTDGILATFDANIAGGNIRLMATPVNASTSYKIIAFAIHL